MIRCVFHVCVFRFDWVMTPGMSEIFDSNSPSSVFLPLFHFEGLSRFQFCWRKKRRKLNESRQWWRWRQRLDGDKNVLQCVGSSSEDYRDYRGKQLLGRIREKTTWHQTYWPTFYLNQHLSAFNTPQDDQTWNNHPMRTEDTGRGRYRKLHLQHRNFKIKLHNKLLHE